MKERPIIFSGEMVRAILDGRKTQTRRVIRPHKSDDAFVLLEQTEESFWPYRSDDGESQMITIKERGGYYANEIPLDCPYGVKGGRLWVRETWCAFLKDQPTHLNKGMFASARWFDNNPSPETSVIEYRADSDGGCSWRSPIHMPRWASRIMLEITDVRVQQIQDTSEDDMRAEGVRGNACGDWGCEGLVEDFADLWDSINEKHGFGWDANPWVWAITFKRISSEENNG